jgi:hypothetical protein
MKRLEISTSTDERWGFEERPPCRLVLASIFHVLFGRGKTMLWA